MHHMATGDLEIIQPRTHDRYSLGKNDTPGFLGHQRLTD